MVAAAVLLAGCAATDGVPVRVTIPPGASFRAAADSLANAGVVSTPMLFRLYAKVTGGDRDIKAGTYVLKRGAGWRELVDALREGEGIENKLTIPEGWSLTSIVPALAQAIGAPEDSVQSAMRDSALLRQLDIPTPTLEGYVFPDTYILSVGTSPRAAVREMVKRFEDVWEPAWDDRLQQLAMSRHDIVTLASIIEREARLPEERPVISAVYHNRLRAQMPLQADPTVQYALRLHRDRVYYRDLEVDSPYNTYRHTGLPPGPIASPGKASIEAALYPAAVPYLYFVASPDGHHEFRTTFKAHTEAVREARRERRERGKG
ncbi:MAG TPA: endolytic transglycosylase MltG [Gemmatimonadaceae bacterium]|nr:endolytic transglycosylase MltG [Gemmatimonadaceae bacterium]